MCEILHHLNDLHLNCYKNWFLWGEFRSPFDTYWAVHQPIIPSEYRTHQTVTFAGCNGLCLIEDSQNPKYDNFVYEYLHRMWNALHRWRKFCSINCQPPTISLITFMRCVIVKWSIFNVNVRLSTKKKKIGFTT